MIPMPIQTPAETDVRPVRGRGAERSTSDASGFETAFRSLEEEGAKPPAAREGDKDSVQDAEKAGEPDLAEAKAEADPRLSLLNLLSPKAPASAVTAPTAEDGTDRAATIEAKAEDVPELGLETDGDKRAPMRIAVVRRETHFEPTVHAPLSEERQALEPDAAVSSRDLSRMLDERLVRQAEAPSVSGTSARETRGDAPRDALAALVKANERRVASTGEAADPLGRRAEQLLDASGAPIASLAAAGDGRSEPSGLNAAVSRVPSALRETADRPALVLNAGPSSGTMPSVATQVASTVIEALPDALRPAAPETPRAASAFAPAEGGMRLRAGGAALKTLTIQLQPEHLGTLDVTMRLTDGRLALELAADKAETARLLTADRAGLRALLEQAGFSIEDAAISVVARESVPASVARAGEQASTEGNRPGTDARRDGQSEPGARGQGGGSGRQERPERADIAPRKPSSGSVFL